MRENRLFKACAWFLLLFAAVAVFGGSSVVVGTGVSGITNTAGNNVLTKSNGTNLGPSSISDDGTNVQTAEPIIGTTGFGTISGTAPSTAGISVSGSITIIRGTDTSATRFAFQNQGGSGTDPLNLFPTLANFGGYVYSPSNSAALTADWTCGTGGTVASCTAATIIGSGGGVPLTLTFPLLASSWTWDCNLIVGQATAATLNQWNILTATNGPTNVTAYYDMYTAATAKAGGAVTDQAATTTTFQIAPSWTLGGTATKMPVRIWGRIEGASASGTVLSLQLLAPTVADVVTIYRGSSCTAR